jgi:hypothetical protein
MYLFLFLFFIFKCNLVRLSDETSFLIGIHSISHEEHIADSRMNLSDPRELDFFCWKPLFFTTNRKQVMRSSLYHHHLHLIVICLHISIEKRIWFYKIVHIIVTFSFSKHIFSKNRSFYDPVLIIYFIYIWITYTKCHLRQGVFKKNNKYLAYLVDFQQSRNKLF